MEITWKPKIKFCLTIAVWPRRMSWRFKYRSTVLCPPIPKFKNVNVWGRSNFGGKAYLAVSIESVFKLEERELIRTYLIVVRFLIRKHFTPISLSYKPHINRKDYLCIRDNRSKHSKEIKLCCEFVVSSPNPPIKFSNVEDPLSWKSSPHVSSSRLSRRIQIVSSGCSVMFEARQRYYRWSEIILSILYLGRFKMIFSHKICRDVSIWRPRWHQILSHPSFSVKFIPTSFLASNAPPLLTVLSVSCYLRN